VAADQHRGPLTAVLDRDGAGVVRALKEAPKLAAFEQIVDRASAHPGIDELRSSNDTPLAPGILANNRTSRR